jgi:hypothetical protein
MADPFARDIALTFDPEAFAEAVRGLRQLQETFARTTGLTFATNATPPTPEGSPMTERVRDEHGRFAAAPTDKTPVTTPQEAVEQFTAFTALMNDIANEYSLCSTFDGTIRRIIERMPAIEVATTNRPEWMVNWNIQGTVFLPAASNLRSGDRTESRPLALELHQEYKAWATEHTLDPTRASTFLAWIEDLPEDRRTIADRSNPGEDRAEQFHFETWAQRRTGARRPLQMHLAPAAMEGQEELELERPPAPEPEPVGKRGATADTVVFDETFVSVSNGVSDNWHVMVNQPF